MTGHVVATNGGPQHNALVVLSDQHSVVPSREVSVLRLAGSGEDGAFEMTNVPPGEYEVTASIEDGARDRARLGQVRVVVEDDDITDLRLILTPGGRAMGKVVMEDGSPFTTLPEGLVVLVIAAPLVSNTYNQDPAYRHRMTPLATEVSLGANETREQNLTVVRLPR